MNDRRLVVVEITLEPERIKSREGVLLVQLLQRLIDDGLAPRGIRITYRERRR